MFSSNDLEFLRLLKTDIDYFTRSVDRFESLVPGVCSTLQDQWRLQAQARRNFTFDLQLLMEKAERCVQLALQRGHEDERRQTVKS